MYVSVLYVTILNVTIRNRITGKRNIMTSKFRVSIAFDLKVAALMRSENILV